MIKTIPTFGLIESLFKDQIPENTHISIERHKLQNHIWYIYRLHYVSKTSGRTMCVVAKGNTFPFSRDDRFLFYLRQLVLEPKEQAREFSRLAWLEKRARQDLFLSLGKLGNPRVQDAVAAKDTLKYEEYI